MSVIAHYWRKARRRAHRVRGGQFTDVERVNGQVVLSGRVGSLFMRQLLERGDPAFVGRFGTTEAAALEYCLDTGPRASIPVPKSLRRRLSELTGFYPASSANTRRFTEEFRLIGADMDAICCRTRAVFGNYLELEGRLVRDICPRSTAVDIDVLYEPLSEDFQWVNALEGKKVLVIHPFASLIEQQFQGRSADAWDVNLPDFQLKVLAPPQTIADSADRTQWESWFEALDATKNAMSGLEYDVALIGAGAYGPFLAHHAKLSGSVGVNVGGALQLYFQIAGHRWLDPASASYLKLTAPDSWVRPPESMRPEGFEKVEGGCYW